MKFIPLYFNKEEYGRVAIQPDRADTGAFDTSSIDAANHFAEVLEVTSGVKQIKKGDKILVMPWAVDIGNVKGEKIYSVLVETNGITHKVK